MHTKLQSLRWPGRGLKQGGQRKKEGRIRKEEEGRKTTMILKLLRFTEAIRLEFFLIWRVLMMMIFFGGGGN